LAAVLHDAVEDSPLTIGELESLGLNGDALEAVKLLTKTVGADYEAYLVPIKQHPVARAVKIADLEDNLNVRRLKQVTEKDRERLDKYLRAHRFLSE
jgi:hypothetical protein